MLSQLIAFHRHPAYINADNPHINHKGDLLFFILLLSLAKSMALGMFSGRLKSRTPLYFGRHVLFHWILSGPVRSWQPLNTPIA